MGVAVRSTNDIYFLGGTDPSITNIYSLGETVGLRLETGDVRYSRRREIGDGRQETVDRRQLTVFLTV